MVGVVAREFRIGGIRINGLELLVSGLVVAALLLVGPWILNAFAEFVLPNPQSGSRFGVTTPHLLKIGSLLFVVGFGLCHVGEVIRQREVIQEDHEAMRTWNQETMRSARGLR